VQSEFAEERQMLFDYLTTDALLGKFFEPFVFENLPAMTALPSAVFLQEVERCDIYIGIFGEKYGYEDAEGISPTEREYDYSTKLHKTRLVFLKNVQIRDKKETSFIKKVEKELIRRAFSEIEELKTEVYSSLVRYLEEQELLRLLPFDAAINKYATINDIDERKVKEFVRVAQIKRSFPFDETADFKNVLSQLNLVDEERITNAALLLFGKDPQKFMLTSAVKCCQFYGTEIEKPIPSYHIYYGDVFQLIDQSVSFVMSRIDAKVGARDKNVSVDIDFELPREAVKEAIVNAICHRDYTSNASVQVMLFRDRLEIWNPGHLPYGLTVEMLRGRHKSIPTNPLLARPMYLYGSIEQVGTGTEMIIKQCLDFGLKAPEFQQNVDFITTFWRREDSEDNIVEKQVVDIASAHVTDNVTDNVTDSRENQIVKMIQENNRISLTQLAKKLSVTKRTIIRDMEAMKEKGIIRREGNAKSGHWEIND
jgi:predicted HTH transcriptional regulator